ncbi:uncharacterized protein LACBIDRAFT_321612 [Laccaria bicolor S238N-H82]|uniref:Predicted protein n=1 Tax=Laccaria bicolor (strain S238N-H82 / ATCC MYA-4686) TaxID=486041 RepID=B0CTJ2_LACBS|nr:uncharacterized protein LACBIDRAFT_321612 [Laccaria bicolor S238N-H82]EDR14498.1 predicted protein [Laccaria bicolor S238N-H82]|eukprot:XP_001875057.1 predicted protein [Laccaria bicolor S238N-H82]
MASLSFLFPFPFLRSSCLIFSSCGVWWKYLRDLRQTPSLSLYGLCLYAVRLAPHSLVPPGLAIPSTLLHSMAPLETYWGCPPPEDTISIFITIPGHPLFSFSVFLEGLDTPFLVKTHLHIKGLDLVQVILSTLASMGHRLPDCLSLHYKSLSGALQELEPSSALADVAQYVQHSGLLIRILGGRLILKVLLEGDNLTSFTVVTSFISTVESLRRELYIVIKQVQPRIEGAEDDMKLFAVNRSLERQQLDDANQPLSKYWWAQPPRETSNLIVCFPTLDHSGPSAGSAAPLKEDHPLAILAACSENAIIYDQHPILRDEDRLRCKVEIEQWLFLETPWLEALTGISLSEILILGEYHLALDAALEFFRHGAYSSHQINPDFHANPFQTHTSTSTTTSSNDRYTKLFILRGHMGIGKTIFLAYVLRLRLDAGLPTLFMDRANRFYFFNEGKAFDYQADSAQIRPDSLPHFPVTTWCLVKTGPNLLEVPSFLQNLNLFILQSASPRPIHYMWLQQDLISARHTQPQLHTEQNLRNALDTFGPSAGIVYSHASNPSFYEGFLKEEVQTATLEELDVAVNQVKGLTLEGKIPSCLLLLTPGESRNDPCVTVPSRFITYLMVKTIKARSAVKVNEITTFEPPDCHMYLPSTPRQLSDGVYCPSIDSGPTFDGFFYNKATNTAIMLQATVGETHSVKKKGIEWLQEQAARKLKLVYLAVVNAEESDQTHTIIFPKELSNLVPEKYFIVLPGLLGGRQLGVSGAGTLDYES